MILKQRFKSRSAWELHVHLFLLPATVTVYVCLGKTSSLLLCVQICRFTKPSPVMHVFVVCVCVCVWVCARVRACVRACVCVCDEMSVFLCLCKRSRHLQNGAPYTTPKSTSISPLTQGSNSRTIQNHLRDIFSEQDCTHTPRVTN